jgi:general secretion pathway protein A
MTLNPVYATLGLSRNPFPPTPDAESYFFTPRLEEDFTEIAHCIEARKGFALLTGEVGLGKSTMVRRLLDMLQDKNCHSALVLNTFLQDGALLSAIQSDFGLPPNDSVEQGLARLNEFLIARHQAGETCLLVIDDAQNLSVQSLELIRLLCNLETGQEKLLQILLVGQPELEQTLAQPELRQLKSRITKHARLSGLQKTEVGRYFDFRVNAANAEGRLSIDPAAADQLYRATQGNLRQIHLVLDRCLYGLASARQSVVTVDLVRRALGDLPSLGEEKAAVRRLGHRGRWVAAGLLAGTTATVALAGFGLVSWPSASKAPAPGVAADAPAAGAAPTTTATAAAATAAAAAPPAVAAPAALPQPPAAPQAQPTALAAPAPAPAPVAAPRRVAAFAAPAVFVARSDCENKLAAAAGAGDTLHAQPLPDAAPAGSLAFQPSDRMCRFVRDNQPWVAWLGRGDSRQITLAQQATRNAQIRLKAMGLLDLSARSDGLFGPRTREAFARFQQQQGLAPTGQPDDLTFFLLEQQDAPAH